MKKSQRIKSLKRRGLPVRKMNLFMALFTLIVSILLLVSIYRTNKGYGIMTTTADDYMKYQKSAYAMQRGSDYLTEQVRTFAETGERKYLDNYFDEAKKNKSREEALEQLGIGIAGTKAYKMLNKAMEASLELMNTEYYSMRLILESSGEDVSDYPEEIQEVELSDEDKKLSKQGKAERGRMLVFDDAYHKQKNVISNNTQICLEELVKYTDGRIAEESTQLQRNLVTQQVLIILLIIVVITIVFITTLLVISPLFRAIIHIRAEQPIPIKGSSEFRFLARTYNLMYETNRENTEHLAYEATHDNLTGVYNRNGYDFLKENVDFNTSAMLLVDIDEFKKINDIYGHETGDLALKRVADAIKEIFRNADYICRIGGDEFVIIMVGVKEDHKLLITSKVEAINKSLEVERNGVPAMSVSVGVAFGNSPNSSGDIFEDADEAMYRVKRNGKKGCAFY